MENRYAITVNKPSFWRFYNTEDRAGIELALDAPASGVFMDETEEDLVITRVRNMYTDTDITIQFITEYSIWFNEQT